MSEAHLRIEIAGHAAFHLRVRGDRTGTVGALLRSLPFESTAERWGDEVYFSAPFHSPLEEDARAVMEIGDVAFWPQGGALAIFFGRTPASTDDKPRAYSPCNIVGSLEGDLSALKAVRDGARVTVSLVRAV